MLPAIPNIYLTFIRFARRKFGVFLEDRGMAIGAALGGIRRGRRAKLRRPGLCPKIVHHLWLRFNDFCPECGTMENARLLGVGDEVGKLLP